MMADTAQAPATAPVLTTDKAEATPVASPETRVFVGNLPPETTDAELRELFSAIGNVEEARIVKRGRRFPRFGFVTFSSKEATSNAVEKYNESEFKDHNIKVELSVPKKRALISLVAQDSAVLAVDAVVVVVPLAAAPAWTKVKMA